MVEKTIKVAESTHSGLMAVKMTGGYKSVDQLIKERVFNGTNGSSRATTGTNQGGAHAADQTGKDAGRDHTQSKNRGQPDKCDADSGDFIIES